MITILSVLGKNKNKNEYKQEINLPEYPPCSRCKSRTHFNLECMYKNISK